MADYSMTMVAGRRNGVHHTLTTTAADEVTIDARAEPCRAQVVNRSTAPIFFRDDGEVAVAEADGTWAVPPAGVEEWYIGSGSTVVSVVGDGDAYSVQARPGLAT